MKSNGVIPASQANYNRSNSHSPLFQSDRLWSRWETKLWTIHFFMGTCTLYASRVALPICATAMAQEYGWSKTDSGTVMSCFFWGYAGTQVVAGGLADLVGGERILLYTTAVWSLLTFFTPQLFDLAYWSGHPLLFLLLVRVFTGVGQGFHLPSMASIISRHLTAADKGRVFGVCLAGSHFGSVIAGSMGSILLEWFGWRTLFQFVGLISLTWWVCFHMLNDASAKRKFARRNNLVYETDANSSPSKSRGATPRDLLDKNENTLALKPLMRSDDAISDSEGDAVSERRRVTAVPWATLFQHPAFWAASVAQYCGANAYFTMFSWLPSYFSDNFPHAKAVVYNVVPSLAIVVTSMVAPFFATRIHTRGKSITFVRRFMESISLLGMAVCFAAVSFFSADFHTSLALFTLAMAARGFHHGGVSVNPHDFAPNHTGSVFGVFNAFSAVTGFVGVYAAGWILQATSNNWSYVFVFTAFQCVLGAAVYASLGTGNKII